MNSERFDQWTRALFPRRTAIRRLAGSLALLWGMRTPLTEARAAKRPAKRSAKRCRKGKKRCKKRCIPRRHCCTNGQCPRGSGKVCKQGRCQCRPGAKLCGARCIPATACCTAANCLPGQVCSSAGVCGPTSPGILDSADPFWQPCGTMLLRHYETYTFTWPGGPFQATMAAPSFNAWLHLYLAAEFNPAMPCPPRFPDAPANNPGEVVQLALDLPAGQYALIATNVHLGQPVTGPFAIGFGPQP